MICVNCGIIFFGVLISQFWGVLNNLIGYLRGFRSPKCRLVGAGALWYSDKFKK